MSMSISSVPKVLDNGKMLLDELRKLENSFYNIDSGLIQHPDIVQFARSLEYFKEYVIGHCDMCLADGNGSKGGNTLDFIDRLQLQQLDK